MIIDCTKPCIAKRGVITCRWLDFNRKIGYASNGSEKYIFIWSSKYSSEDLWFKLSESD
jgi:hypothetical protein